MRPNRATMMPLRHGRVGALNQVLLDEKVESGHGKAKRPGAAGPVALDFGRFGLPEGYAIAEAGTMGGLAGRLGIIGRDPLANIGLAFPVGEGHYSCYGSTCG